MLHSIRGIYAEDCIVILDGKQLFPKRSFKYVNHSPTGFAWGYGGSGPSQLAFAILLEAKVKPEVAMALHHYFKDDFLMGGGVSWENDFHISVDIEGWVAEKLESQMIRENVELHKNSLTLKRMKNRGR